MVACDNSKWFNIFILWIDSFAFLDSIMNYYKQLVLPKANAKSKALVLDGHSNNFNIVAISNRAEIKMICIKSKSLINIKSLEISNNENLKKIRFCDNSLYNLDSLIIKSIIEYLSLKSRFTKFGINHNRILFVLGYKRNYSRVYSKCYPFLSCSTSKTQFYLFWKTLLLRGD